MLCPCTRAIEQGPGVAPSLHGCRQISIDATHQAKLFLGDAFVTGNVMQSTVSARVAGRSPVECSDFVLDRNISLRFRRLLA